MDQINNVEIDKEFFRCKLSKELNCGTWNCYSKALSPNNNNNYDNDNNYDDNKDKSNINNK